MIDSAAKRFSMLNFGRVPTFPLFQVDGDINPDDRLHLLNLYSGFGITGENPQRKYIGLFANPSKLMQR